MSESPNTVNSFVVVMESDISREQAALIQSAIMQMRGVLAVEYRERGYESFVAEVRIKAEYAKKMRDILNPPPPPIE
jgi:cell division protein FtsX